MLFAMTNGDSTLNEKKNEKFEADTTTMDI